MTVADRAKSFLFRSHFLPFVSSSAVGWRRAVGGGFVGATDDRLSVCLRVLAHIAAYFCVVVAAAAGQVINVHLRSLTSPLRHPVVVGTPDELLTSSRSRRWRGGNEWPETSHQSDRMMTTQFILTFVSFPRTPQMHQQHLMIMMKRLT